MALPPPMDLSPPLRLTLFPFSLLFGVHVNTAVTFDAFVGDNISLLRGVLYRISQHLGSTVACLLLKFVTNGLVLRVVPRRIVTKRVIGMEGDRVSYVADHRERQKSSPSMPNTNLVNSTMVYNHTAEGDRVECLPGQPMADFKHYPGYVNLNVNKSLFY